MPFELRIALRYLTARRKQAFISLISFISIVGVGVGVMALFVALGLMTGLQREIRAKILGTTAHLSIFRSQSAPFENYRAVAAAVRRLPRVRGSAPTFYGKALLTTPAGSAVATLKGIVPSEERTVTDLAAQVETGRLEELEKADDVMPAILLGRDLAATLGVGTGDVVTVTSPHGRLSPMGVLPRLVRFRVAGTVWSGL